MVKKSQQHGIEMAEKGDAAIKNMKLINTILVTNLRLL
jgi:hypothetical protein